MFALEIITTKFAFKLCLQPQVKQIGNTVADNPRFTKKKKKKARKTPATAPTHHSHCVDDKTKSKEVCLLDVLNLRGV